MSADAVWLLIGLFAAHYLGDFTSLLTPRMLMAKREGGPVGPIALHGAIHGALAALAIGITATPQPGTLALGAAIVLFSHFAIDLARARLLAGAPAFGDASQREFWLVLGFDQLLHGVVLIAAAAVVL